MDTLVTAIRDLFAYVTGVKPRFRVHGGSGAENLALQNIQARLRMVVAYLFAQLMPWVRGRQGGLLVLGSASTYQRYAGILSLVNHRHAASKITSKGAIAHPVTSIWSSQSL